MSRSHSEITVQPVITPKDEPYDISGHPIISKWEISSLISFSFKEKEKQKQKPAAHWHQFEYLFS